MRLELTVLREGGREVERDLSVEGDCVRIGSHASNDLALDDGMVSRFHCRLQRGASSWVISDTGSLNGTRMGGMRVRDADLPVSECVLELGESVVRVREGQEQAPAAPPFRASFGQIFGTSMVMRRLFAVLEAVAASDATVLVEGESGTGKELVAGEIVRRGRRATKPFVIVDCGSISPSLIEAQLFGHVRGAFTGADRDRSGAFETADGGTVFLDEIGEMPLDMQPKLLRVLEAREVRRLGEAKARRVDVRVLAATNRRLDREVNLGRFREDLYFRLSVITVRVPPLRERLEDLDILVRAVLEGLGATASAPLFTRDVVENMARHDWPGNVRELRNFVERAVVLRAPALFDEVDKKATPTSADAPIPGADVEVPFRTAKDAAIATFERAYVAALLTWSEGNISRAARKAGMDRMNLHRLVQRYGLKEALSLKD